MDRQKSEALQLHTSRGPKLLSAFPELIDLPVIRDDRGALCILEYPIVPFDIKRIYYLFDLNTGTDRGSHAHRELRQILVTVSGSCEIHLTDGRDEFNFQLNSPAVGLHIPPGFWRRIGNFSGGATVMVIASMQFDEGDYIRDWEEFLTWTQP